MSEKICCLILNYNDFEETIACVNNLLQIDKMRELIIVVVDNHSSNGSFEIIKNKFTKHENIRVLQSEVNGGYSKGNNIGFRYITEHYRFIQYTILMNPDTRIRSINDIEKMLNAFKNDDHLAIVAPIVIMNGTINYEGTAWNVPNKYQIARLHCKLLKYKTKRYIDKNSKGVVYVDAVQGGFFMIRMKALVDIGYIDESIFLYSEEVLLSRDLMEKGYSEAVLTDVFFEHNHKGVNKKTTLCARLVKEKNSYKSRIIYCKKYLGADASILLTASHLINYLYIFTTHPIIKALKL